MKSKPAKWYTKRDYMVGVSWTVCPSRWVDKDDRLRLQGNPCRPKSAR